MKLAGFFLATAFCVASFAANAADAPKEDVAEKLAELTDQYVQNTYHLIGESQLEKSDCLKPETLEKMQKLRTSIYDTIGKDADRKAAIKDFFQKNFTEEEIRIIYAFRTSDVGRKMDDKYPALSTILAQRSMSAEYKTLAREYNALYAEYYDQHGNCKK